MEISEGNLTAFREWLLDRGRSDGTASLYLKNLRQCAAAERLTRRVLDGKLAPLTRRTNKAALIQWARFSKNPELAETVLAIKLPPAKRSKPKLPLPTEEWRRLVKHLATRKMDEPMRAVCLIIAKRGLRVSDAVHIQRTEVTQAVKTGVLSYVGKGSKRHEVSAEPMRAELETLADATGWKTLAELASSGKGPHAAANRIRRLFNRLADDLGLEGVYPHRFRRTYARHFIEEYRGDPRAAVKLQQHMGWANLNTALSYADDVDHGELALKGDAMSKRLFEDA